LESLGGAVLLNALDASGAQRSAFEFLKVWPEKTGGGRNPVYPALTGNTTAVFLATASC